MNPPSVAPPVAPPGVYPGTMMAGGPYGMSPGMPGPPFNTANRPAFNPWDLVQALKRRWLLATVLGLVFAGSAAAVTYWYLRQPEYRMANATAYFHPRERYTYYPPPNEAEGMRQWRLLDEAGLAGSMVVVEQAAGDPELAADPNLSGLTNLSDQERIDWIAQRVSTSAYDQENKIIISVSSIENESWLPPVANALLRAYVKTSNEREMQARKDRFAELHKLFMENGGELEARIAELHKKQRDMGTISPQILDVQYAALLNQFNDHVKKRNAILSDNAGIEIDKRVAKESLGDSTVTKEEIESKLDTDATYLEYLAHILSLQEDREISVGLFKDGANNAYIKKLQGELDEANQVLEEYVAGKRIEIRDRLAAQKEADINSSLSDFDKRLRRNALHIASINEELAKSQEQIDTFKHNVFDTRDLEKVLSGHEFYEKFRKEINILEKEKNAGLRIETGEVATYTQEVPVPSPWRKIGLAAIIALGVVLAGVSLLEYRVRRIHTTHEVVQGLGIRLLGAIPAWSPRAQGSAQYGGANLGYNFWTESVDTARTMVTHAAQAESARVVMITSAVSGEGKTSLASHLAGSLARAGHRTLLVDGDLRRPAIHALFDLPPVPGLCEVLRGQATLDQAIQNTPARGLAVLASGQCDADALQALAQGAAGDLFKRFKELYDYVIIDSSPVLAVADALLLGRHVDGVLLSILRDVSRMPTVYAAHQRLSALGIRTLGAVVNGAQSERYGMWYATAPAA